MSIPKWLNPLNSPYGDELVLQKMARLQSGIGDVVMDSIQRGTDYAQSHRQRFLRALRQPKYHGINRRHGIGQLWKLRSAIAKANGAA